MHAQQRCIELEYIFATDKLSSEITNFILEKELGLLKLNDLVSKLRKDYYEFSEWEYDDVEIDFEVSSILLDSLESAADRSNALAHYALALINKPEDFEPYDNHNNASSYWYSQAQKGKVLTGFQKEWADEYAQYVSDSEKYIFHIRESGRKGNEYALLELAEYYSEPSFFEKVKEFTFDEDPIRIAEIAHNLNRHEDVKYWLTIAAESGDTDAMRRLIEEFDNKDLQRCWMWLYLAKMTGTDLTQSNYHAIHENGSLYDDDVGGAMFADGIDGISIPTHNRTQLEDHNLQINGISMALMRVQIGIDNTLHDM